MREEYDIQVNTSINFSTKSATEDLNIILDSAELKLLFLLHSTARKHILTSKHLHRSAEIREEYS